MNEADLDLGQLPAQASPRKALSREMRGDNAPGEYAEKALDDFISRREGAHAQQRATLRGHD
jgi:hypothetical protein